MSTGGGRGGFLQRVMPVVDGCHLWTEALDKDGYGKFRFGTRSLRAHRFGYELRYGPIPDGMYVDHKCRVRSCVNPEHLRLVTPRQNVLENSNSLQAKNAVKTRCLRGHDFDRVGSDGGRRCTTCANDLRKERRRKE